MCASLSRVKILRKAEQMVLDIQWLHYLEWWPWSTTRALKISLIPEQVSCKHCILVWRTDLIFQIIWKLVICSLSQQICILISLRGNGQNYLKSRIKILIGAKQIEDTQGTWTMSLTEVGFRPACLFFLAWSSSKMLSDFQVQLLILFHSSWMIP